MNAKQISLMLLTLIACTNTHSMEKPSQKISLPEGIEVDGIPFRIEEIWLNIIAQSPAKQTLRETCRNFCDFASIKNENIWKQNPLAVNKEIMEQRALYYASLDNVHIVINLLNQGLNPNTNNTKMSLLDYAAKNNNSILVDILIKNPNQIDDYVNPFDYALRYGYSEIAKRILTAAHNTKDILAHNIENYTLIGTYNNLMANHNSDILDLILSLTDDARTRYKFPITAIGKGLLQATTTLLDQNAHMYTWASYATAPLPAALMSEQTRIVKLLIDRGADVSEIYQNGDTPLHFAIRQGDTTCLQLLIDHHVAVPAKEALTEPVYTMICHRKDEACASIIQLLLNNGFAIDEAHDEFKDNPLIIQTAYQGHIKTISLLLKHVVNDINVTNAKHKTALDRVSKKIDQHYKAIRELLIEHGAKTGKESRTITIDMNKEEWEKIMKNPSDMGQLLNTYGATKKGATYSITITDGPITIYDFNYSFG